MYTHLENTTQQKKQKIFVLDNEIQNLPGAKNRIAYEAPAMGTR